jgi:hypothetical protein
MLKTVASAGATTGTLTYAGTWNASTNTPTLTSSVGTLNNYYVVSVAGSTNLNGITTWNVGDWAIFNGSVWERVLGGTTESFANIAVTTATGYLFANGSNLVSATTTIPVANVTGAVPNTVNVLVSGLLTGGGALTGNVTVGLANVPNANVTGLGTMATQNANNVTITGGTENGVSYSNVAITSGTENAVSYSNVTIVSGTATLTSINLAYSGASSSVGPINVGGGMAGGPDTGLVGTFVGSANNYTYMFQQNTSNGTAAYSTYTIATNDYSAYANFGINNNAFVGSPANAFNSARNAYWYSHGSDAVFGSYTANAVHFIANGGTSTSDAMTINANNTVTINTLNQSTSSNATFGTASLPLVPAGFIIVNLNGSNVKIPYYNP